MSTIFKDRLQSNKNNPKNTFRLLGSIFNVWGVTI